MKYLPDNKEPDRPIETRDGELSRYSGFRSVGTDNLVIGLCKKMGSTALNVLSDNDKNLYFYAGKNTFRNEKKYNESRDFPGIWPFSSGKPNEVVNNFILENRSYVVLIRDVLDKWKSGYHEELRPTAITFYDCPKNYPWFDNVKGDVVGGVEALAEPPLGSTPPRFNKLMSDLHNIENGLECLYQGHAEFWRWNDGAIISLLELSKYENVYFLDLKDLSNPKFLEWLQEKDEKWKGVEKIEHFHATTVESWQYIDSFWKKYSEGKILKDKILVSPFYDDLPGWEDLAKRVPIGKVSPQRPFLNRILKQEQEQVDFIREHDRYIRL